MALGRLLFEVQELVASAALTCALCAIDVTINGGPVVPSSSTYDRLKQAHISHDGSEESSLQWLMWRNALAAGCPPSRRHQRHRHEPALRVCRRGPGTLASPTLTGKSSTSAHQRTVKARSWPMIRAPRRTPPSSAGRSSATDGIFHLRALVQSWLQLRARGRHFRSAGA